MSDHHRAADPQPGPPPTPKQQAYLRRLALERGISFAPPRTRAEASREIEKLKARRADSAVDRVRELRAVQADMAIRRGGAARVRGFEVEGHGSSAQWSERS